MWEVFENFTGMLWLEHDVIIKYTGPGLFNTVVVTVSIKCTEKFYKKKVLRQVFVNVEYLQQERFDDSYP